MLYNGNKRIINYYDSSIDDINDKINRETQNFKEFHIVVEHSLQLLTSCIVLSEINPKETNVIETIIVKPSKIIFQNNQVILTVIYFLIHKLHKYLQYLRLFVPLR